LSKCIVTRENVAINIEVWCFQDWLVVWGFY